jgi:cell wall-associated protease
MFKKSFYSFTLSIVVIFSVHAQKDKQINWYNTAKTGLKTEKAYKFLTSKNKKGQEVIVAVIDSGVDIEHEDLVGKIWINSDEVPGNNIDDDHNGYVDDINGWNFLGNSKGENQEYARYEKARIYVKLKDKFENKDKSEVSTTDLKDFELFQKVKNDIEDQKSEYESYKKQNEQILTILKYIPMLTSKAIGKKEYTLSDVKKWKTKNDDELQIKYIAIAMLTGELSEELIKEQLEDIDAVLNYQLNPNYDDRGLIGDNPNDIKNINYGNNNVEGPDALHGTHVSGIITALRGNSIGGDGVAENVKIMSLRAVPNGDEHDKDIALAIRYAVDNGASIINMSFGKPYSMFPEVVYKAIKYADSLGVLLVHAAGNDNKNIDVEPNFPAVKYEFQNQKFNLLLTIGASTEDAKGNLAADFSNYGKNSVDVFAPGKDIYNTIPNNKYKKLDGTSMAAPMVAGVAAVLKSYYPKLTMQEIKDIILKTSKNYGETKQLLPGSENEKVSFSTLTKSGGVVDLFEAVKFCETLQSN